MKKKLFWLSLSLLAVTAAGGFFFYRFRHQPRLKRLTDNFWAYTLINKVAKITDLGFVHYYFYPNSLDTYQLFIKGKNLEILQLSLPDPVTTPVVIEHNQEVPAVFVDPQGLEHNVKVRFRGYGAVHWAQPKKSWRIIFSGGDTFNGLASLDLIIPEDRGLVFEHLANFRAGKLGLLAPDSWFANLTINQQSQGVYYVTEKLDEAFFTRRNLTGTLFGEKDQSETWNVNIYESVDRWRTYPEDPNHPDFKYLKQLLDLVNDPGSSAQEVFQLLDKDSFLAWRVHSLLMASLHQDKSHNNRLFFNHQTKKFVLTPWDTGDRTSTLVDIDETFNPLAIKLLQDPQVKAERNRRLAEYLNDPVNRSQDLEFFENSWQSLQVPLMQDTNKFHPDLKYLLDIKNYRLWMLDHFDNLNRQL